MPGGTDQAWERLTPSYQVNPGGGRQGYERFWNTVERVSTSAATGLPPNKAQATITYVYKSGRTVRERTEFGLVNDAGVLKINTTRVVGGG